MCGAYTLQSTWDGKHQSKHMNLRHVNIVSHKSYIRNTALLYTFQNRKMGGPKNEMPILWAMVGFFFFYFPKKHNWKKPFNNMLNGSHPLICIYYGKNGC